MDPSAAIINADVLVVGAGPTGLMAATLLAQDGTRCVIVDAGAGPTLTSKAALVQRPPWSCSMRSAPPRSWSPPG